MDYLKLKNTIESSKISISELCREVGMSRQTFYNNLKSKNLTIDTLELICEKINVPVKEFLTTVGKMSVVSEPQEVYNKRKKLTYKLSDIENFILSPDKNTIEILLK